MKKLLFILLITPALSFAQLHVEIGLGASHSQYTGISEDYKEVNESKVLPVFKLAVGYEISNVVIEVVEQPTLSRLVNSPKLFGGKIGYNFNGLVPSVGYYFNSCNSDNTEYNSQNIGYSLKYQWAVNDNAGLYAEVLIVGKNNQITAGMHYTF